MSETQITQIRCRKVFVPFRHQVQWSGGVRPGTTRLLVEVVTAGGIVGLGETICLLEFIEPVLKRTLAPLFVGEDACDIERLLRKAEGAGYYHHKRAMVMALCGLEMACWDIVGRTARMPVHRLWGGRYRTSIPLVAYLQSGGVDQIAAEALAAVKRGHRTIKVKLGQDEAHDLALVRAVRETVGPDVKIRGDCNGAWTIGTAKRQLRKLADYDLEYIEQPLPLEDLGGLAHLRQTCGVPIALDESAYTLQDVHDILRHGAADMILLDPHEAGGLWPARKQAALCEAAGIPVSLHSGGELGVSTAAYLHFAASVPNLSLAIDLQYPNISGDVITAPFDPAASSLEPPTGPGLGVALDEGQVTRHLSDVIPNPYLDPSRPGWFTVKPAY